MKKWGQRQKMIASLGAVLLITILVWYTEKSEPILSEEGQLLRQKNGEGEYEAELVLQVDGKEETEFLIVVPEQYLTMEEEEAYLEAAIEEIDAEFAGENASLEEIRERVMMRTSYQEGKVLAEWEFSKYRLIAEDGTIVESEMEKDCEEVGAKVYLTCEDSNLIYEFYFMVYRRKKNEEEILYEKLNQLISESGETEGTELLRLPTDVEGHSLVWKNKASNLPVQVFFIGLVVVLLIPALEISWLGRTLYSLPLISKRISPFMHIIIASGLSSLCPEYSV